MEMRKKIVFLMILPCLISEEIKKIASWPRRLLIHFGGTLAMFLWLQAKTEKHEKPDYLPALTGDATSGLPLP